MNSWSTTVLLLVDVSTAPCHVELPEPLLHEQQQPQYDRRLVLHFLEPLRFNRPARTITRDNLITFAIPSLVPTTLFLTRGMDSRQHLADLEMPIGNCDLQRRQPQQFLVPQRRTQLLDPLAPPSIGAHDPLLPIREAP